MFLSRLELDQQNRNTMKALVAPSLIHGALTGDEPPQEGRTLWRLDSLNGRLYLLVLSPEPPKADCAVQQFGMPGAQWESRDYTPLLQRIQLGSRWHFRLTANPTISSPKEEARGIVHAHSTPVYQQQWLLRRCEKHGFALQPEEFRVVGSHWNKFRKGRENGRPVSLLSVTFEGELTVTDPQLFREVLTKGIGRGKAYGLGMLTVVRVS